MSSQSELCNLKFAVFFQSVIMAFLLNIFSCAINLLSAKLAHTSRIYLALSVFFVGNLLHWSALGPYCQHLRPISSQYSPCTWLIKYIYVYA